MFQLFALFADDKPPPSGGPFGDPTFLIMMAAVFAAFYFIVIMPARRKEKKERESLLNQMKKNDEVLTASGIIGIIANVKDDEVVLKVDESSNVRLRVLKSSIVRVLNPKEAPKDASAGGSAAANSENVKAGTPPAK
jgi:preprotein translocase subunit YajC